MQTQPLVSVVMAVYNGATELPETLDSVLSQENTTFEFIVVDDGSTDDSYQILDQYAAVDNRVKLIRQENQGLTKALSRGCALTQGQYIARQDVGDISLPGRLAGQAACLRENNDTVLVSCGTRFVGPAGEPLYEVVQNPEVTAARLGSLDLRIIEGPPGHGSTMFRNSTYLKVGGYRDQFYFAQDLDLWLRLLEKGTYSVVSKVLYQVSITVDSVSGRYRSAQIQTARRILECATLRRQGRSETAALERARRIRPRKVRGVDKRIGGARAAYFIGSCLEASDAGAAKRYFKQALGYLPVHLKSWWKLTKLRNVHETTSL